MCVLCASVIYQENQISNQLKHSWLKKISEKKIDKMFVLNCNMKINAFSVMNAYHYMGRA